MPANPLRPCKQIGCPELTREGYCPTHKHKVTEYDRHRGSAAQRGYDGKWRKARVGFLKRNPLCRQCEKEGSLTEATVVDHIIPHKGDYKLFWDRNNWQPLCKPHHDSKTATEDGGFGNATKV